MTGVVTKPLTKTTCELPRGMELSFGTAAVRFRWKWQKRKWLENGSPLSFDAVVRAPYQVAGPVVQSRHHADDASGVNIFEFGKGPALPQHLDAPCRESLECVELELNGLAMGNFLARPGLGWHGCGQSQAHGVTAAEGRESGFHAFGGGLWFA
ncbi:hypothetical protein B0T13DRAFT_446821 [Neurospora crassa]|nr:hypothetical protein B0T13DRAFT_446821 [Neurospora crassa]